MATTKIQKEYLDDELPHILSGAGAPGSTPAKVGDIYIDTTNDNSYIAVGTASSADWKLNGGGGGATDRSVRVYQSAGTSLTTTLSAVPFNTESFDTDTMHDNVTNNTRITFTTAGKYLVTGIVNTDANAGSYCGIRLNGSTYIATNGAGNVAASTGNGAEATTIYDFAASDYVELMGAFGTTQTTKSGIGGTQFSAFKIF